MTAEQAAKQLDRATTECAQAAMEYVRIVESHGRDAMQYALADLQDAVKAWKRAGQTLHDAQYQETRNRGAS